MTAADAVEWASRRIDLAVLGAFMPASFVGIYYAAQQVATLPAKLKTSFEPVLGPAIARKIAAGDRLSVAKQVRQVTYWIIAAQLGIALALAIPGRAVMGLVGSSFTGGTAMLAFLLAAEVIAAAAVVSEAALIYVARTRNMVISLIMIALWTGWPRWFEVAYFWGIGGTLQAILTPNLHYAFPDTRCISFFVGHSGIIVAIVFLMLTRRLRPYPMSILRAFFWAEVYFVCALIVDQLTQVNYGYLLHKPDTFSLLSYLSDSRPLYLLEFQVLALVFFVLLYIPFAVFDAVGGPRKIN